MKYETVRKGGAKRLALSLLVYDFLNADFAVCELLVIVQAMR